MLSTASTHVEVNKQEKADYSTACKPAHVYVHSCKTWDDVAATVLCQTAYDMRWTDNLVQL